MLSKKRMLPIALALLAASTAAPVHAQEEEKEAGWWFPGEFSGMASLTNNYVFRGITQTDDDPAIQGSINYKLDTGLAGTSVYAGVWGSNVDFNDGDGAHVELDWTFGLTGEVMDTGLGWSLGGIYYHYPAQGEYSYWEIAPALSYTIGWVSLVGGVNYSPDFFNGSGEAWYPNGGVKVAIPIPDNWFALTLEGYTGHQWVDDNARFGAEDYQDWKLGLSVGIKMITLSAYYTDTNLDKDECAGTNNCDARAVLALTATF